MFIIASPWLPELREIMLAVEAAAPQYTRLKEMVESVEAFKLIVAFLGTGRTRMEEEGSLAQSHTVTHHSSTHSLAHGNPSLVVA